MKHKLTEGKTDRETQKGLEAARVWRRLRVGNSRALLGNSATSKPLPSLLVPQFPIRISRRRKAGYLRLDSGEDLHGCGKLGSSSSKSLTLSDQSGPQSTYLSVTGTVCPWLGLWRAVPPLQHGPHSSYLSKSLLPSADSGVPRQESRDSAKGFPTLLHSWHSSQASQDPTLERKKAVWEKQAVSRKPG